MTVKADKLKTRSSQATSKILADLHARNSAITASGNEASVKILQDIFGRFEGLSKSRVESENQIAKLNQEYVQTTQNVLNDKTLDFLVQHSQIDAPTLTSIFAGFELARASRADKIKESRDLAVEDAKNRSEIQAQQVKAENALSQAKLNLIQTDKTQALKESSDIARLEAGASLDDIQREDRIEAADLANRRVVANREDTQDFQRELIDLNNPNNAFLDSVESVGGVTQDDNVSQTVTPTEDVTTPRDTITVTGGRLNDEVTPPIQVTPTIDPVAIDQPRTPLDATQQFLLAEFNTLNDVEDSTLLDRSTILYEEDLTEDQSRLLEGADNYEGGIKRLLRDVGRLTPDELGELKGPDNNPLTISEEGVIIASAPLVEEEERVIIDDVSTTQLIADSIDTPLTYTDALNNIAERSDLDTSDLTLQQLNISQGISDNSESSPLLSDISQVLDGDPNFNFSADTTLEEINEYFKAQVAQ